MICKAGSTMTTAPKINTIQKSPSCFKVIQKETLVNMLNSA